MSSSHELQSYINSGNTESGLTVHLEESLIAAVPDRDLDQYQRL